MKKLLLAGSCIVILAGCANPGTVIPKSGGTYQAVSNGYTKAEALDASLRSAHITCKRMSKRHVVIDDKTTYKGVVDEETNKQVNAGRGVLGAFGVGTPSLSTYEDYENVLTFQCE